MEDGMKVWIAPQSRWETLEISKIVTVAVFLFAFSLLVFCVNKKLANSAKRQQRLEQLAITK